MKKWIKPNLLTLGVTMTMEEFETLDPKVHDGFCHDLNNDCTGRVNEHNSKLLKSHTMTGTNSCVEHGPGQPSCCCAS